MAAAGAAAELLRLGEIVLEHWLAAHGKTPTMEQREGFRLLALHRQGAKGEPSFNACRETCRELVYHYNLIMSEPDHPDVRAARSSGRDGGQAPRACSSRGKIAGRRPRRVLLRGETVAPANEQHD